MLITHLNGYDIRTTSSGYVAIVNDVVAAGCPTFEDVRRWTRRYEQHPKHA